jgi:hypothetical protein
MNPKIAGVSTNIPASGKALAFSEVTLSSVDYFGDAGVSWVTAPTITAVTPNSGERGTP